MELALALTLGLVVGVVTGAVGAGGSILTIPALIYLLGQNHEHAALGSLIIVGVSSVVGLFGHHAGGRVRWREGFLFSGFGVVASMVGARVAGVVSERTANISFALLLIVAAGLLVNTAGVTPQRRGGTGLLVAVASVAGLLTGFFGVGGGFVVVPALILVLGFGPQAAIGTSLLVIALNSLVALGFRIDDARGIDWTLIAGFSIGACLGAPLGGRITARVEPWKLTYALAVLLVLIAAAMFAEAALTHR